MNKLSSEELKNYKETLEKQIDIDIRFIHRHGLVVDNAEPRLHLRLQIWETLNKYIDARSLEESVDKQIELLRQDNERDKRKVLLESQDNTK